jgi:hypothetical protein
LSTAGGTRARRTRPITCPECGSRAQPRKYEWPTEQRATGGYYECGTWDQEAHAYKGGCGWTATVKELQRERPELLDDGRIRGPEDVAVRIAGARARREADPALTNRELVRELHELYCETAERHSWVEVMAADIWAEHELSSRLGRKVHRTQVRRARLALEGRGYVRTVAKPHGFALREQLTRHKLEGRRPPIVVEVLKAQKA